MTPQDQAPENVPAVAQPDERTLRKILDSSPVCFAFLVDDRICFATPCMTDFLGANVGDRFGDFFAKPGDDIRLKREIDEHGVVNWLPVMLRTKKGVVKEMLANMFFVDDIPRRGAMLWLIDVTDIRQVEADLRLARDAAEASVRTKSEFLANMSHEIRTPMNAILGMTHLALRTGLDERQRKYLEGTEQSAKLLLRIINDILDFSKIEAGKMLMEYHEFSLGDVMADLEAIVSGQAAKKNLELTFDKPAAVPDYLMGDSVRLRQVLVNLATNAIKFTENGSVTVSVRVREQDELSVKLLFSVRDTGIGMAPDRLRFLFRPFSQADMSTTRKYGGTGLGLAISKSIVQLMKGDIWCESVQGQGSTFSFTACFGLPLEGEGDGTEVRTDVLLLGDELATLKEIRNYLELLRCKIVAQCRTLEEFDRFVKTDRIAEVDFIVYDFEDIRQYGKPMISALYERYGDRLPPVFCVEHFELYQMLRDRQIPAPQRVIRKPVNVSELFDILVFITERKKDAFRRPRKPARDHDPGDAEKEYRIPESIRGARILLAEDNRINQMVATELLTMEGFRVDVADNGRKALEMLRNNDYDLILMDIQMPEMDGLEATKAIRAKPEYNSLPILAMTAHAMAGDRETSLQAGMNDHITKPIDPKNLFVTLAKWIKR